MKKTLPNIVYVWWDDDEGFLAEVDINSLPEGTVIGSYALIESLVARQKTQIKRKGARTWFDAKVEKANE